MENNTINIRSMQKDDVAKIVIAFNEQLGYGGGFEKYINRCYEENEVKERITFIAFLQNEVVGYVNIIYIGLGVGLYKDYGSAQRLYTKNGYIFDGNGLMYNNIEVIPGKDVFVDDELLLYLYKKIG